MTIPTSNPKKGYACGTVAGTHAPAILTALRANWYYNWGFAPTPNVSNSITFIPMAFSKTVVANPADLAIIKANSVQTVLGFNEPDIPQQANMTVPKALASWKTLSALGLTMGSPATAGNPTAASGWLSSFIASKPGHISFICVHWYGPPTPAALLNIVDTLWKKYQKPVWITEFAVANWTKSNFYSSNQVMTFMSAILPALNSRSYVARYAWKDRVASDPWMGSSCLVDLTSSNTGFLTPLGQLYSSN